MPYDAGTQIPRRIALFSGNYNYVMDGAARALNKLVGYLEEQGIEVLIFAPTADKPAFKHKGTLVSVPSFAIPGRRSEYRISPYLPKKQQEILEKFNPDIVHLSAPDLLGQSALRWARKNKVPAVASFHTRFDTYFRYYHLGWLEKYVTAYMRRFYHKCEQIYVPTDGMIELLKSQNMAKDIRIWSRGIDRNLFHYSKRNDKWRQKMGLSDDKVTVAFVGRLVLEKGIGNFADTLKELEKRGVPHQALIVGAGPERETFEKMLPNAVFTGHLSGEDLSTAYACADIFFNSSITETFGNVTLEAMTSGLPCVCANSIGNAHLVKDGENGFLVEYGDIQGYADKIAILIEDRDLHARMREDGIEKSRSFTWDIILGEVIGHYQHVMKTFKVSV
ncbi:glycosyltransferase family 4 protein [Kordiimonas laminariae]|uniref:glycosyltransferase family 4 protein n=1 Tax=Kordiimonas laminariae TaxID=2917717 RepID=UPI001FF484D0|nr:glycosyltransferase family 1 protein [Kordiimonas laminariae]MCK0070803.1 glycosyltransferase family 1 protein [Kordiimonas laminariae]